MNKVLFIGIDAAEPELLTRWMADGSLPNLKAIAEQGGQRLVGYPQDVVIHPWSSFYTGRNPGANGVYHYITWNPAEMASERFNLKRAGLEPFWRRLPDQDLKVIALDMPMVHKPDQTQAVEVHGWATHEVLEPFFTSPPELKSTLGRALGPHLKVSERYGLHSASEMLAVREELLAMVAHHARLVRYMIDAYPWDLMLTSFLSMHLGGHKLWDITGIEGELSQQEEKVLRGALKEIYMAVDQEIGQIVSQLPSGTTILVSSFHGMTASTSRVAVLPDLVSAILNGNQAAKTPARTQRPGLLSKMRNLIPATLRHRFKKSLPFSLQDRLTSFWRQGGIDWSKTPAFALVSDFDGYVQINLKGRERDGIVLPGEEYEHWISKVSDGLMTFRDRDSGKQIVERVVRREVLGLEGPLAARFPDLTIQWSDYPCAEHRTLVSPLYGEVAWPTPGKNPDGRSGNHLRKGLFLSNRKPAPDRPGSDGEITVQDVTATIYHLLGQPIPEQLIGRPVIDITAADTPAGSSHL